jgi:hypothetical protein
VQDVLNVVQSRIGAVYIYVPLYNSGGSLSGVCQVYYTGTTITSTNFYPTTNTGNVVASGCSASDISMRSGASGCVVYTVIPNDGGDVYADATNGSCSNGVYTYSITNAGVAGITSAALLDTFVYTYKPQNNSTPYCSTP